MDTFARLTFGNITDGIPIEKIKDFLEAGILFTVETPGRYVFIADEGRVFLRSIDDEE